jgi:hypothetical protein
VSGSGPTRRIGTGLQLKPPVQVNLKGRRPIAGLSFLVHFLSASGSRLNLPRDSHHYPCEPPHRCSYRLSSPSGKVATGTMLAIWRRGSRVVLPERQQGWIPSQQRIELSGDVPLQAPEDLFLRQALGRCVPAAIVTFAS